MKKLLLPALAFIAALGAGSVSHAQLVLPGAGGSSGASGITIGTTAITSGTNTRILFDDSGVVGESAGLTFTKATSPLPGLLSLVTTSFGLSGNISAPAWTTAGIRYKNVTATMTDTSSSGTVAAARTDNFGGNTIAASAA